MVALYSQPTTNLGKDTALFSHAIAAGQVYILPQDKMPCLKPDSTIAYNMPVQTGADKVNSSIPNAFMGKPLTWGK